MIYDDAQFPQSRKQTTQHVLREVARATSPSQPPAPSRRWWAAGLVSVAAVSATGAGLILQPDAPTDRDAVDCHTTIELGDGDRFIGTSMQFLRADGRTDVAPDAVSTCAWMWRDGWLTHGSGPAEPTPGTTAVVPELTACVTSTGVAAVFPAGESICGQLGLAPLV